VDAGTNATVAAPFGGVSVAGVNAPGGFVGSLGPPTGTGTTGLGGTVGYGNTSGGSLGPASPTGTGTTSSQGAPPGRGGGVGGAVPGFGNMSLSGETLAIDPRNIDINPTQVPGTLGTAIATLESSYGANAANQPPGMADAVYGQYPGFVHDYGGVPGEAAVNAFAQKMLAQNPNLTLGDMYASYALGHPTTFAALQAQHPDYAANLSRNFNPGSPVAQMVGYPDAASAAESYFGNIGTPTARGTASAGSALGYAGPGAGFQGFSGGGIGSDAVAGAHGGPGGVGGH